MKHLVDYINESKLSRDDYKKLLFSHKDHQKYINELSEESWRNDEYKASESKRASDLRAKGEITVGAANKINIDAHKLHVENVKTIQKKYSDYYKLSKKMDKTPFDSINYNPTPEQIKHDNWVARQEIKMG